MNAKLLNVRHSNGDKVVPETWVMMQGDDAIQVSVDERGVFLRRFTTTSRGKPIVNEAQMAWDKVVDAVEGQLPLFA